MSSQGPEKKPTSGNQIDFLAKLFASTNEQQFSETVPESTEAAQTEQLLLVRKDYWEELSQCLPVVEAFYDETEEEREAQERRAQSRKKPGKP